MRQGLLLLDGRFSEVDYAWSLPLASMFALLHGLGVPARYQPDLISVAVYFTSTLALWWALRKLIAPTAAFLAASWWAASAQALNLLEANTYALGLALACAAIGLVAKGRYLFALGLMVIAGLNRGELSVWLAAAGVLWIAGQHRDRIPIARIWGWSFAASGTLLFAMLSYGWRARNRSWFAFRQHFEWGHPDRLTTDSVFPGAASLPEALHANSTALLEHVQRNLAELPSQLLRLVFDAWLFAPWVRFTSLALLSLLAALGAVRLARFRKQLIGDQRAAVAMLAASPAVLITGILLLPRVPLLLPTLPLALFAVFGLASVGLRSLAAQRTRQARSKLPTAGLFALPLVLALATTWQAPMHDPPENRAAIELIREHVTSSSSLLAFQVHELLLYAEVDPVEGIEPTTLAFDQLAPDFLLDSSALRTLPGATLRLEALQTSPNWRLVEQRGAVALFASVSR